MRVVELHRSAPHRRPQGRRCRSYCRPVGDAEDGFIVLRGPSGPAVSTGRSSVSSPCSRSAWRCLSLSCLRERRIPLWSPGLWALWEARSAFQETVGISSFTGDSHRLGSVHRSQPAGTSAIGRSCVRWWLAPSIVRKSDLTSCPWRRDRDRVHTSGTPSRAITPAPGRWARWPAWGRASKDRSARSGGHRGSGDRRSRQRAWARRSPRATP